MAFCGAPIAFSKAAYTVSRTVWVWFEQVIDLVMHLRLDPADWQRMRMVMQTREALVERSWLRLDDVVSDNGKQKDGTDEIQVW